MQMKLKQYERGSALLLLGVIALIVMLLLGVTAIRTTMLQERLAGGFAEQYQAFQAAEMALRAGEILVNKNTARSAACFYAPGTAPDPKDRATWSSTEKICNIGTYYRTENYGAAPPKFFIEQQEDTPDVSLEAGAVKTKEIYKVTALGTSGVKGENGNPVVSVILQSSITH
ncbi:MAG: hypothetical protein LBO00_10460 [Zoogloeaceae bacterium]|jgi:type IV pilus assembly protein PilX|nr:hypothetical protein [Zoogloeaceae bacterium]